MVAPGAGRPQRRGRCGAGGSQGSARPVAKVQGVPLRLARRAAHRLAALRRNTLALVFWLLAATVLSGLVSLLASVLAPGTAQADLRPGAVYAVPRLELSFPPLVLRAGPATVVALQRGGHVAGILVLAEGTYAFAPEGRDARRLLADTGLSRLEDAFTAAFVSMASEEWQDLARTLGATPVRDADSVRRAHERAAAFLREQAGELRHLPLGLARQAVLRPSARWLLIAGRDYGRLRLTYAREVTLRFVDLDRRTLTYANPGALAAAASPLFPGPLRPSLLLIFGSTALILVVLTFVLTADLERPPADRVPTPATASELPLVAALVVAELLAVYTAEALRGGGGFDLALLYALFAGIVLTRPAPPRFRFSGVGLSRHHLLRAITLGLVVGALGHFAATLSLPHGLREVQALPLLGQAGRAFLLTGLAVEVYRRGLVQTAMERRLGYRTGLLVASAVFGAVYTLPRLVLAPSAWPDWLLQGMVVLPVTELVFGYMYHRTGTVLAGATARAVLELLGHVLA